MATSTMGWDRIRLIREDRLAPPGHSELLKSGGRPAFAVGMPRGILSNGRTGQAMAGKQNGAFDLKYAGM
jgi:hypothetical protein